MLLPSQHIVHGGVANFDPVMKIKLTFLPQSTYCSEGVANFNVMMNMMIIMWWCDDVMMMMVMMMMMMIMTIVSVEQRPGWGEHVQKFAFFFHSEVQVPQAYPAPQVRPPSVISEADLKFKGITCFSKTQKERKIPVNFTVYDDRPPSLKKQQLCTKKCHVSKPNIAKLHFSMSALEKTKCSTCSKVCLFFSHSEVQVSQAYPALQVRPPSVISGADPKCKGLTCFSKTQNERSRPTSPYMMTDHVPWSRNNNDAQQSAISKPQRRSHANNYVGIPMDEIYAPTHACYTFLSLQF